MSLVQTLKKRISSSQNLLTLDDFSATTTEKLGPRTAFFRRRIRLRGNSSISLPLGLVLLIPCLVIILLCALLLRHPASSGKGSIPAGAPPTIRYVEFESLEPGPC